MFTATILLLGTAVANADSRFPVREKIPAQSSADMDRVLDWQRTLVDMSQAKVYETFGAPYKTLKVPGDDSTIHASWRLSRLSTLQITFLRGTVAAVAVLLLPSVNEDGPLDD